VLITTTISRRIALLAVTLCAAAPAAAAIADPQHDADIVTLRFWNVPEAQSTQVRDKAEYAVYQAFLRQYPNYRMEKLTALHAPREQAESADLMALAGGSAPDVLEVGMRKVQNYIDQGFLHPLNEFGALDLLAEQDTPREVQDVMFRGDQCYAIVTGYNVMGLIYRRDLFEEVGLDPNHPPENWDELFEYAMELTDPEKELEGFSVYDRQQGQYGLGCLTGFLAGWTFTNFVWQGGGDMVHQYWTDPEDGWYWEGGVTDALPTNPNTGNSARTSDIRWKVVYDSPEAMQAFHFYKRLRWAKWARSPHTGKAHEAPVVLCGTCGERLYVTEADVSEIQCHACGTVAEVPPDKRVWRDKETGEVIPFDGVDWEEGVIRHGPDVALMGGDAIAGKIAMAVGHPGADLLRDATAQGLRPDALDFAALPAGPTGIRAHMMSGGALGINATVRDPRVRQAAWDFIRFRIGERAQRIRTDIYVRHGWGMLVRPALLKKFGYDEYYEDLPDSLVVAYDETRKHGRVEPYCPGYQNVQTAELATPIDLVLTDRGTHVEKVVRESTNRVNSVIMREIEPEVMAKRRTIGWIVAAVVMCPLVYATRSIFRDLRAIHHKGVSAAGKLSLRKHLMAWVFLAPALGSVFLWQYVPLLRGSVMAFQDYKILGGGEWIGIDNFVTVFTNPDFYQIVVNTVFYVVLNLALGFGAPIFLALMLSEIPRFKMFFRTVYYLPAVTTGVVIMLLWKNVLLLEGDNGVLNQIIGMFGAGPINWLGDPRWRALFPFLSVIIPAVWAGAGPGSILYLAALKTVPEELYEAADLDGAGTFRKALHVTVPTLKPLIIINFVGAFIGAFHAAQNVFVMTGGGPARRTLLIGLDIWFNAFLNLKFGYATALAWVLASGLIGFTMYQLRILKKIQFTRAEAV